MNEDCPINTIRQQFLGNNFSALHNILLQIIVKDFFSINIVTQRIIRTFATGKRKVVLNWQAEFYCQQQQSCQPLLPINDFVFLATFIDNQRSDIVPISIMLHNIVNKLFNLGICPGVGSLIERYHIFFLCIAENRCMAFFIIYC